MAIPWVSIISAGVVPLVKWAVKYGVKRRDEREQKEKEQAEEEERRRLKAQTARAIRDAKEGYQDIDPSKYNV